MKIIETAKCRLLQEKTSKDKTNQIKPLAGCMYRRVGLAACIIGISEFVSIQRQNT